MKSIYAAFSKGIATSLFLLFLFNGFGQAPTLRGRFDFIDNNINGFWEYLPWHYTAEPTRKYPLIIFMHGKGEEGNVGDLETLRKVLRSGTPRIIDRNEFPDSFQVAGKSFKVIVLAPQIKDGFNDATMSSKIAPSTIQALINYAKANYRVDTTRIYLTGLSMGGGATWNFAGSSAAAARQLAGIVTAAGAYDLSEAEARTLAQNNVAVIATHNLNDNVISAGRTVQNINRIVTANNQINPYPKAVYWDNGGHNVWRRTFEDLNLGGENLRDTLGVTAYEYMLQFQRQTVTVPVVWKSFIATTTASHVSLRWSVSNQINVQSYRIERSSDGSQFNEMGSLPAKNLPQDIIQYEYRDRIPATGDVYYRIRQVDFDGRYSFSKIEKVSARNNIHPLIIFPNPFADQVTIDLNEIKEKEISIHLTDGQGKILHRKNIQVENPNYMQVPWSGLSTLAKGTYHFLILTKQGKILARTTAVRN